MVSTLLEALQKFVVPIPAIVVTADCNPAIIGHAMAAGAVQCLTKPVDASGAD
jgi:CheY-like chemotaxis protein